MRDSINEFDGISHGSALDLGLKYVTSDIVCLMDSDFFILNNNIHDYVLNKFSEGYLAVGAEWNDGEATIPVVNTFPDKFDNIPCCFCGYYDVNIATSNSWVITPNEIDRSTSFIEVGWRIRKYILDNNIKSMHWKTNSRVNKNCVFRDNNDILMGVHYVAGSHRRIGDNPKENILNELKGYK